MKCKYFLLVAVMILGVALIGCSSDEISDEVVSKVEDVTETKEDKPKEKIVISNNELAKAYDDDKMEAKKLYDGQLVEVSGIVDVNGVWSSYGSELNADVALALKSDYSDWNNFYILCEFFGVDAKEISTTPIGELEGAEVTVEGIVHKEFKNRITIKDCKVVNILK